MLQKILIRRGFGTPAIPRNASMSAPSATALRPGVAPNAWAVVPADTVTIAVAEVEPLGVTDEGETEHLYPVGAPSRWKQEKLDAGVGARTMLCALHVLGAVFKHARRFGWTSANPLENVHRPRHEYEVKAFTPEQIRTLLEVADPETALIVRLLASTGLRFGELAGLRWSAVDLERGVIQVREQFTHGAWAELKTANARRSIPLPYALRDLLKARYSALNHGSVVLRPREDDRLVFTAPEGGEIDANNWRTRHWLPLLKATAPDAKHPKRQAVTGTPHMLRHAYATALIQSGENAKTVQTLMGHHSVAFTMDQYADAWPEALSNAGEKAAALLFASSGSKTVAAGEESESASVQVSEKLAPPTGVEPVTYRLGGGRSIH
jgi:integrase